MERKERVGWGGGDTRLAVMYISIYDNFKAMTNRVGEGRCEVDREVKEERQR